MLEVAAVSPHGDPSKAIVAERKDLDTGFVHFCHRLATCFKFPFVTNSFCDVRANAPVASFIGGVVSGSNARHNPVLVFDFLQHLYGLVVRKRRVIDQFDPVLDTLAYSGIRVRMSGQTFPHILGCFADGTHFLVGHRINFSRTAGVTERVSGIIELNHVNAFADHGTNDLAKFIRPVSDNRN